MAQRGNSALMTLLPLLRRHWQQLQLQRRRQQWHLGCHYQNRQRQPQKFQICRRYQYQPHLCRPEPREQLLRLEAAALLW
jgi:hypothetical protein